MKRWLRAPAVQAVLGLVLAAYLKLVLVTMRWRVEGRDIPEAIWAEAGPVIVCFWHARIALSAAAWPMDRVRAGTAQAPRALVSLSPDGAFLAAAIAWLGVPAIRGSSTKAWDKAKPKGGAWAFREALRWLDGGGGLAITPDGPRGPAEQMAQGAALLAARSGAPVLLLGLACRPCSRLSSWDRTLLPLPFGRGAMVWDGPVAAPAGADRAALDTLRLDLERRLSAATARAEAMLA
ncbi:MAG TPA: lysophospholipid acyltransferase family protein [Caulobacteraceae bacterium]|nr:lysophospholipid acyltransferase family protein [Caulobacteraceae bacterium]